MSWHCNCVLSSWFTCPFAEWQKHSMAGVGRHLWRSSSLPPPAQSRVKKSRLFSLLSSQVLNIFSLYEEKKYFLQGHIHYWMPSELTTTILFPLTLLTQWNYLLSSMITLCWAGTSFNIVFHDWGTLKMLLINISGTEQIFAYQLQLPAVLCFDFEIRLEIMSWKILEHPDQN